MRDIAPDYLNRLMSYVDALLWLDQASIAKPAAVQRTPIRGAGHKKLKSGRGKPG